MEYVGPGQTMTSPDEICGSLRLRPAIVRQTIVAVMAAFLNLWPLDSADAAECVFPDNVNWVVNASCEVSGIRIAPQNLSVINGATLTVESSGEIILDMRNFQISIAPDSRLIVELGGRIRSNQIGPLLVRGTDGGTFGYFLKRVGGPVLDTINPDLSFHPSSAIKVLYMIEVLRQVDNGTLNLGTTNLTSCPTTVTPGPGQTCPNSFTNPTVGNAGGGNCGQGVNLVANSATSCGAPTQAIGLGVGTCAMMKVSNNPTANAIQETVGAGNPQTGWNNMLNNAGSAIGLSATTFANRMGCGGPNNVPNNQTTLRDLGLLYEQMATNPAVLFPVAPPVPFIFQNTNAYNFMDNHFNELNVANFIPTIVNEQAGEIGLSATTITNFLNGVRLVHKSGNNGINFVTLAGWISFPINAGATTRDYVYGVFVNNVTTNSLGTDLRDDAAQMLRSVIRDAMEDF